MALLGLFLAGLIGWAMWSGKLKPAQLLPVLLAVGGAMLLLRGNWIIGAAAAAAGVLWFQGQRARGMRTIGTQTDEYDLSKARWLLGVSAHADADEIRARHRELISQNHPDRGGSESRAVELNKARDLLLDDLAKRAPE